MRKTGALSIVRAGAPTLTERVLDTVAALASSSILLALPRIRLGGRARRIGCTGSMAIHRPLYGGHTPSDGFAGRFEPAC